MNRPTTYLGQRYKRPACLAASVFLLQLSVAPASAQLLAMNTSSQRLPLPAVASESVLLKSLLKQWEQDYHATIFYESKLVDNKRVSAQPSAGSLATKLAAVLPQVDLQFKELRANYFVVTSRDETAGQRTAANAAPQNVPVSGRVTQANGEGLPGVTVLVKGTTIGTSTGSDGSFTLSVPEGSTLVFSSIGFKSQELAVTGATSSIAIKMDDDAQSLKEVVVVGYGTQTRQELSTAVTSVGAAQIARQPVAGFDQALQGQAPGVQVTAPSGAPGAGINVRVRGNASLSLNGSPLYVIDGVPVLPDYSASQEISVGNQRLNPLNTLNPNDIESIDVLKDGAAAAIYGVRAANGVVVITTKRGKVGQAQVGLSMYYGKQYLRKKLDVLNSSQFAQQYNETIANFNAQQTDPNNIQAVPFPSGTALPPYNTDWQDEVYRAASLQNYQLNVSGGTEKTRYYVAGGYFKQDGISQNSGFDRFNFKVNLEQTVSDKFRLGTNLNMSRTHTNGSVRSELALGNSGTVLGALSQIPTIPVRNANGTYGVNPFNQSDNPVGDLLETSNQAIVYQMIGNVYGEYDLLKNLRVRSSLGLDFRTQTENQFISRNYPGTANSDPSTRGSARTATNQQVIWLWENTLTYNPTLGERHHLTLLGGQSMQASNRFTSGAQTQGFVSNAVPYLSSGATVVGIPGSYNDEWALLSYFARANYDFDGKYLFSASLRADGTSRFTDKYRFGYFPAVSAAWRLSKERFFPQTAAISDLKLRASFGANGNQEIYAYQRFSRYSGGRNYQGGGSSIVGGITQTDIGNNDLRWETTYQYNGGLDLSMLDNRLTFTFDIYNKQTKDLLLAVPIPTSTGVDNLSVTQNIGKIENKGIEIGLVTTNVEAKDGSFGWTTNFNVSGNRNKVIDLGTQVNDAGVSAARSIIDPNGYSISQPGQPLGSFFGYVTQGIVQSNAEGQALPSQNGSKPLAGDIRFADINGDGVINDQDRTIIGNPNPKLFAGVTNNFTYKGIELSVFFQGSFGNDIYNQTRQILESQSDPLNQTVRVLNHWTPTNTNTDIPRPVRNDPNGNNRFSNRWLEDGSYVRLKNLTVAYNFPTTLTKHAAIQNLRLYVTGQNLITWTHYLGYDPEVSADPFSSTSFGRDYGVYPQSRTYTVGLNANF
ncbi:SusC/RagA family TonB-linked outer membrane protein [Hymenobacter sp. HMF4947]|uniref:SusC/RagA family TonB-linked outer membrane protein n=1 Tax=Hymenobacter ginkgonis TaxID=2682976 RepID=A0A7K1TIQ1_9BACT|nr:TonB-dependent receptor [Hymenobacter ginkgonis]MVN78051.1 SusC/RagA family TonB-linked outer membrane protein [Hymenobacter ginkgonis]